MIYVMSDLHGQYKKYISMLEKINFGDTDTLYILGDVCDRGEGSAELYLDIMSRGNVHLLKGNHESMLESYLPLLLDEFADGMNATQLLELYGRRDIYGWFVNGGDDTVASLFERSDEERRSIYGFIQTLPTHLTIEHNGLRYIMVHGGVSGYSEGCSIEDISDFDLVWSQPDFNGSYFGEDCYLIVGHTPTFLITDTSKAASVYRGKGNVIAVDCGAPYPIYKGRLGCLRLDDNREFYV